MLKRLMTLLVLCCFMISIVGCGSSEPTTNESSGLKTVENGKLLVAMECQYPPFNWTQVDDSNGAVAIKGTSTFANGYDVQIAKNVAKELGLDLEVVKLPWDSLSPAVQSATADLVMAGMSPTAERRKTVDFSEPYYESQLVVVINKDGRFSQGKSLNDFKDARITAQLNTFHANVIDQIPNVSKQKPMKDFGAMREALKSNIIDGYVSEKVEGLSASSAIKAFGFVEFPDGQGFKANKDDLAIAAGVKKGNSELMVAVNEALNKISKDQRDKIMENAIKEQPISE